MYCPDIHHNLSINYRNQNLQVGPCCQATHSKVINDQIVDHPRLIEIRDLSEQGKSTVDCNSCIQKEKAGGTSRRQHQQVYYKDWKKQGIRGLDITIGNLCNLKCVICGAHSSTTWFDDWKALGYDIEDDWQYDKKNQYNLDWLSDFNDLEIVHFTGGEPLLNDTHVVFLNKLNENHILKNCRVTYNTNATQTPTQDAIELWKQADVVELYFSLDDINHRFNYQRSGADWDRVRDILRYFYDMDTTNHLFHINITWSYLNIYYLPKLIDWIRENFSSNRFGDTTYIHLQKGYGSCQINSLTQNQFDVLEERFNGYDELEHILKSIKISSDKPTIFIEYIQKLDKIRSSSYDAVHKEWAELIYNDKYTQ